MDLQHSPGELQWVQQLDSLAFSESPVGPSTENNTCEDDREDCGSMHNFYDKNNNSRSDGDNDDEDDEESLAGENIWNGAGAGSGNCGIDQEDVVDMNVDVDYRRQQSFKNENMSNDRSHVPTNILPTNILPGVEIVSTEPYEDREAVECKEQLKPYMIGSRCQTQDKIIEIKQADDPPRGIEETGKHDDRGEEESAAQSTEGDVEQQREKNGDGNGWIDERVDGNPPAWHQDRPALQRPTDGVDECCVSVSASADEHCPPRRARQPRESPDFERSDSDLDDSSNMNEERRWPSRQVDPVIRPLHGRTRLSLDRERRRLDRLPRSQRLRLVKGHPLGGMTLQELEDRRLLDVGIGEIARRVQNTKKRSGRVHQEDSDLLRRSARLLRRAQRERDARYALEIGQNHNRTLTSVHHSFGSGRQTGRIRRGRQRPASASRDRHRLASLSTSIDPVEHEIWTNAHPGKPRPVDKRRYTNEAAPVNFGHYSGGGTKCSLKQRRPMSAKPAIPCGSDWQSGRTKPRRREDDSSNFDEDRRADVEETGHVVQGDELDSALISSNLVDLSPHEIVEYTNEEESPFK